MLSAVIYFQNNSIDSLLPMQPPTASRHHSWQLLQESTPAVQDAIQVVAKSPSKAYWIAASNHWQLDHEMDSWGTQKSELDVTKLKLMQCRNKHKML